VSFLNGLSAAGASLSSLANTAVKQDLLLGDRDKSLANAMALLNRTSPTADTTPPTAPAAPAAAPPEGDSAAHGNTLDASTLDRAHAIYAGLVARGMDEPTATAFAANAVQESRANPGTAPGDMGASHGAFQWRDARLDNYIKLYGHPPEKGTLDEQLDFVMHEIGGPEQPAWKSIMASGSDAGSRAAAVSRYWERPKDTDAEMQRRSYIANQLSGHFARLGTVGA
jgi:hypothetical protein